jgi:hypothetical protein
MFSYECDYSEENGFQKCKQEIGKSPLVPRSNSHLLYEGKQFGVCRRGTVLCDHRGDLSLANPCSRRRITRIFAARTDVSAEVDQPLLKTMRGAERASQFRLMYRWC